MKKMTIRARSLARRLGLIPLLSRLRNALGMAGTYEEKFDSLLQAEIRPGDVVWDIGANVGLYTERFSQQVGPTGRVVAFEPVPTCFRELQKSAVRLPNVQCVNAAVGSSKGTVRMTVSSGDGADPGNRIEQNGNLALAHGETTIAVAMECGDDLLSQYGVPNVVKIDVEGFELEVIAGMRSLLQMKQCRALFIEVHFTLLERAGKPLGPATLVEDLKEGGFPHVQWADSSHLVAYRSA